MLTVNFTPFPLLRTDRLVLRPFDAGDATQLLRLRSDKKVMEFLDRPSMQSEEEARVMIERIIKDAAENNGINWAISLQEDPELIGTIGYWRIMKEHFRAEIGYMILPEFHGKGLMQEAMTAVINYAFGPMQLHSIEANVNPDNTASIKILEKNKFIREAYYRENYYYDGKFLDSAIYSLLAPVH